MGKAGYISSTVAGDSEFRVQGSSRDFVLAVFGVAMECYRSLGDSDFGRLLGLGSRHFRVGLYWSQCPA